MRFQNEDEYKKFLASRSASSAGTVRRDERAVAGRAKAKAKNESTGKAESSNIYRIVVIAKRHRHFDTDNIVPKWAIDQLVEAGFLPDDSSKYVESLEKRVEKIKRSQRQETVIEIWKEQKQ